MMKKTDWNLFKLQTDNVGNKNGEIAEEEQGKADHYKNTDEADDQIDEHANKDGREELKIDKSKRVWNWS